MIDPSALRLVHYCHPGCVPLRNIMRLPRDEAFAEAARLAASHPGETAFGRFADFENYYPRRLAADERVYRRFAALGGRPRCEHPLFFVLQGSDYLHRWFADGPAIEIPLGDIPLEAVSFTYGDSTATFIRTGDVDVLTKEALLESIARYGGTLDEYMREIAQKHRYIEAQLWDDACVSTVKGGETHEH